MCDKWECQNFHKLYIFLMDSKEQLYNSLMMRPFLMTCISSIAVVVNMTRHHVCILNSADWFVGVFVLIVPIMGKHL